MRTNTWRMIDWLEENPQRWKVSRFHKASTSKSKRPVLDWLKSPMGITIPTRLRSPRRCTSESCRWCGARQHKKIMFKLRDGPIDWWFCNDEHAEEWVEHRHKTPAINAMLRTVPALRDLGGKTIDEWVRDELSHASSE